MTRTLILSAAVATLSTQAFAGGVAADTFLAPSFESSDFIAGKAIDTPKQRSTFSTKNTGHVSALEVALKHAEEDDNRALAAHIRAQLGR